ncbi:MAG: EscJ/YscJ/HrcJ family type III secretion inner membrane ring protein [Betaproteobacteria bacterium]|nr:EscJ/YscJ/HrcJ family type III secretion inner membrane ring protein [Betaproteobacteria bacterium]
MTVLPYQGSHRIHEFLMGLRIGVRRGLSWLGACAAATLITACTGSVELLASIPEPDANEVIAALVNAGIRAEKVAGKEGMVGVRVEAPMAARAVDTLRVLGLPREHFSGMGQVFRKDGLISSPVEERARYLSALSQDLSATLSRIDGVLFARVHLVLPERGPANEADTPSTAAVFIKHQKDVDLELLQPQVRRMVVNSIPNLAPERVSIVLVPSNATRQSVQLVWTTVLGFRVEADAATPLRVLLSVLALLAVLGIGVASYLGWKYLYLPRKPAPSEDTDDAKAEAA